MLAQDPNFMIYIIYEGIIIIFSTILLVLAYSKFLEKKHQATKMLFFVMLNWTLAVVFSWLSKVLEHNNMAPADLDSSTLLYQVVGRIVSFRVSFFFVLIALYLSYNLRVMLFDKGHVKSVRIFHATYAVITGVLSAVLYEWDNTIYDVTVFTLVFLYMFIVYGVFMGRTLHAYKNVSNASIKKAFLSLVIMCVFFILVFLNFLLDRVLIL
ncbi:MAG: hypothetical protein ACTSUE_00670, partial [Promethearchaeota archaeon]